MTKLRKDIRTTYVPGLPGHPGSPGQPYRPAYSGYLTQVVCAWRPYTGGYVNVGPGPFPPYTYYAYSCIPESILTNFPAQPYIPPSPPTPGTPGQFLQDFQLGWTGRAASTQLLIGPGYFTFKAVASVVGAVVGLAAYPAASGYADIIFGFHLANGRAQVFESGFQVYDYGVYASGDVFKIRRVGGQIEYAINGTVIHQSAGSDLPLYLTASLYAGGDEITDAVLLIGAEARTALQALAGFSGESGYTGAVVIGEMLPLSGLSGSGVHISARLLPLAGFAGVGRHAEAKGSLLAINGYAEGIDDLPAYAIGAGRLGYMTGASHGLTGQIGQAETAMQPLSSLGYDRPFGEARGTMPGISGFAFTFEPVGSATVFSSVSAKPAMAGVVDLYVFLVSRATAHGFVVPQVLLGARMVSAASVFSDLTVQQVVEALLASTARLHSLQFDDAGDVMVWALNAATAGTTRYENYNFNSFAKIGAKFYGMKADGLYELAGADDAGQAIRARINLGNSSFGTSLQKSMSEAYVGVASTGAIVVKVVANDETYYYTARGRSDVMQTQRVDFGRGFKATFFELEIQNDPAGGAFDLASIEFTPVPLKRRI